MITRINSRRLSILKFFASLPLAVIMFLIFSCSGNDAEDLFVYSDLNDRHATFSQRPDKYPDFKGSYKALATFIDKNLKYPKAAEDANLTGKIIVRFNVNKDGTISDAVIAHARTIDGERRKKLGYGCEEEALRVVNMMPPWEPALYKGEPVKMTRAIAFIFGDKKKWDDAFPPSMTLRPLGDEMEPVGDDDNLSGLKTPGGTYREPGFKGGYDAMINFLIKNLKYPEEAKKNGIEGSVIVAFTLGANGEISNAHIKKGIGYGCDEEALRVVKMMPPWEPYINLKKKEKVNCNLEIPIEFKLSDKLRTNEAMSQMPQLDIAQLQKNIKYPDEAKKSGEKGKVLLGVLVSENGKPLTVDIESSAGETLDQAAIEAVKKAEFTPALDKNGKPAKCRVIVPVSFKLQSKSK